MKVVNVHAGVGAGKYRYPFRIKEHLSGQGIKLKDVAEALEISHSVVSRTIGGVANNHKVLTYLKAIGVPARYLSLPPDMR